MEMLVTQALDERDLLKKKINDAIDSTTFVSVKKVNADKTFDNAPVEKYTEDTKATYQSINDMIKRYYDIIQKIAESNAKTIIKVDDKEMTISAAISVLKDISNTEYFESRLLKKLKRNYENASTLIKKNNDVADQNKHTLLQNLVGRNSDKNSKPTADEIALVENTIARDYAEFVDPIDITNTIVGLTTNQLELKSKILMAIKVSNATTTIEI